MFYIDSTEVMDDRSWMYRDSPKDCGGWIIVTVFRVLLISQHLSRGILLMAVLGAHAGSAKI
jgi:hypothetical protein